MLLELQQILKRKKKKAIQSQVVKSHVYIKLKLK